MTAPPSHRIDLVAFGVVIDDLLFPDGSSNPGLLGGGGPQAAFGMSLWASNVGLFARLSASDAHLVIPWLHAYGIDSSGISLNALPTPRARQFISPSGDRTQTWQVPPHVFTTQLAHSIDDLSTAYRTARGFHLGLHPEEPDLPFLRSLKALGGLLSVELFRPASSPLGYSALRPLLQICDVFSLNEVEARSLAGDDNPLVVGRSLLESGASLVTLRLGQAGSLVFASGSGEVLMIPAVSVTVVDPTGAGNAFCGGCLAGLVAGHDLSASGAMAAVSASFLLEQFGPPPPDPDRSANARRRLAELLPQISRIPL